MTFTLAMVQNPHVWKRAQAEIDSIVGTDRLPEWNDRPSLTYVDAVVRETFRWRPVIPLGTCWDAISLSGVLLNIPKSCTQLHVAISTRVTTYPKVCRTPVWYIHGRLSERSIRRDRCRQLLVRSPRICERRSLDRLPMP